MFVLDSTSHDDLETAFYDWLCYLLFLEPPLDLPGSAKHSTQPNKPNGIHNSAGAEPDS